MREFWLAGRGLIVIGAALAVGLAWLRPGFMFNTQLRLIAEAQPGLTLIATIAVFVFFAKLALNATSSGGGSKKKKK